MFTKLILKTTWQGNFLGVYLKHDWGLKGAFAKQLQSNYKAITKQIKTN